MWWRKISEQPVASSTVHLCYHMAKHALCHLASHLRSRENWLGWLGHDDRIGNLDALRQFQRTQERGTETMVEIQAIQYRYRDGEMIDIANFHERSTYINPEYVVSIKPTAVETNLYDIMMMDGLVYRVFANAATIKYWMKGVVDKPVKAYNLQKAIGIDVEMDYSNVEKDPPFADM